MQASACKVLELRIAANEKYFSLQIDFLDERVGNLRDDATASGAAGATSTQNAAVRACIQENSTAFRIAIDNYIKQRYTQDLRNNMIAFKRASPSADFAQWMQSPQCTFLENYDEYKRWTAGATGTHGWAGYTQDFDRVQPEDPLLDPKLESVIEDHMLLVNVKSMQEFEQMLHDGQEPN